jgi:hypothetical protein
MVKSEDPISDFVKSLGTELHSGILTKFCNDGPGLWRILWLSTTVVDTLA